MYSLSNTQFSMLNSKAAAQESNNVAAGNRRSARLVTEWRKAGRLNRNLTSVTNRHENEMRHSNRMRGRQQQTIFPAQLIVYECVFATFVTSLAQLSTPLCTSTAI